MERAERDAPPDALPELPAGRPAPHDQACPSEDALLGLLAGELGQDEASSLREHLLGCELCQDVVGDLAGESRGAARVRLQRGDAVGRYLVLGVRGAGAMGVVYEAYDPELARKVALKLVRADRLEETAGDLHARLLREAQSMARLSHPNVIAVHDVGSVGAEVFVAMELVEGGTLTEHLRSELRPLDEVLALFVQAGRGLAAAHAAGLVHRDFKPDNVLVGVDGRVRVTDFGLARSTGPHLSIEALDEAVPIGATLTRTGAAVGTPAYMAPEVIGGTRPDARADIYAFSVALYEALAGVRPFSARTLGELRVAIERGELGKPRRKVSPRLFRIVQRGLAADPAKRWESMQAMLVELERRPRRTALAAVAVLAAALATAGFAAAASRASPTCDAGESAWGDVWSAEQQAKVRAAFDRTALPFAAREWTAVDTALAERGRAWAAIHAEACSATRVRREQSEAILDRKFACLDERRASTRVLVRLFTEADAELVTRAAGAVKALPALDDCANAAALGSAAPLPEIERPRAQAVTAQIAEAQALRAAGKYAQGLAIAERANEAVGSISSPRLRASALVTKGVLLEESMRFDEAETVFHEGARIALSVHDDADAADAWMQLAGIAGYRREQAGEARVWLGYAETAIEGLGEDRPRLSKLYDRLSLVEWSMEAKLEEANEHFAQSQALRRGLPASESPRFREEHGPVQFDMGHYDVAARIFSREVDRLNRESGPDHPEMLEAAENLAECRQMMGHPEEAIPVYRDLLQRFPDRAPGYTNHRLADALRRAGDARAALVEDDLAIAAEKGAEDALARGPGHHGRGVDLFLLGRLDEALVSLERAATIRRKSKLATIRAETDAALAAALVQKGGAAGTARGLSLAASARDAYREAGVRYGSRWYEAEATRLDGWLKERTK